MPKFGVSIYSVCRKYRDNEWTPMEAIKWLAEQGAEVIEIVPFHIDFINEPEIIDQMKEAAKEAGVAILNWSVDPKDWANHDAAAVTAAVTQAVQDGDVILLHDMCDCSVTAALQIIDTLRNQGFRFVTVSELAQLRGITPIPGQLYNRFE